MLCNLIPKLPHARILKIETMKAGIFFNINNASGRKSLANGGEYLNVQNAVVWSNWFNVNWFETDLLMWEEMSPQFWCREWG